MPVHMVFVNLVILSCLICSLQGNSQSVQKDKPDLAWIWTSEAATSQQLPAGNRWFRKTFTIDRPIANPVDEAVLELTADNTFTVWFNGQRIGSGDNWQQVYRYDVKKLAKHGTNVIAIEAGNESPGAAALLVRLTVIPNGKSSMAINSDRSWKSVSTRPDEQWIKPEFEDKNWQPVHVLGEYGNTEPWGTLSWSDGPSSQRFKVPEGFVVETVIPPNPVAPKLNPRIPFSIINMTFDAKGRLLVSQERGPILLCTEQDQNGELKKIEPYCEQVKNAQGMCWVRDALLVVGDGPKGTGLYRAIDKNNDDVVDEVQLLHKFKGGMGEHGPHAIIHGPDDWLYLVIGNHAWAQPKELAKNSPLTRWPNGYFGPDQGKPGTTEDVLIPRLNDGRGHAANILAPGGTIWRLDHEGNNMSLYAAGFRNQYDAAFRSDGEMFTFDSDMEWDEGMPWYRPVRVCHVPPGADYLWRTGAANTPNYYLDSLEPMVETGRGSPCGVAVYEHVKYPSKYQGAIFLADWSIGVIWAVHTTPHGAGFRGNAEKFCTGSPLNVTDLEVGPDGSIYFTLGGRSTTGGVYRIRYANPSTDNDSRGRIQPLAAWSKNRLEWKPPAPPELSAIQKQLKSGDAYQQRLACDAIIRHQLTVPVDEIWSLLGQSDPFLRTAARLVLQRLEPETWINKLSQSSDLQAMEAIVALCKTGQAAKYQTQIVDRLNALTKSTDPTVQLQQLRTWQLVCIHCNLDSQNTIVQKAVNSWFEQFPTSDSRVNRELGILLSHAARNQWTALPVAQKLTAEMVRTQSDRPQSIYFFYLLRLLHHHGYTQQTRDAVVNWYEATKTWSGGHSYAPFMQNIFKDWSHALSPDERKLLMQQVDSKPHVAAVLLDGYGSEQDASDLINLLQNISNSKDTYVVKLQSVVLDQLGRQIQRAEVQQALRKMVEGNPTMLESVVRLLAKVPARENVKYLLEGLRLTSPLVVRDCMQSLAKCDYQPAPEDSAAYRTVILAINRLEEKDRVAAIRLLHKWKALRFSPDGTDIKQEINGWSRWFNQQFPKETPVPNVNALTASSKWKMSDFESVVASSKGDAIKGKVVFTKTNCIKCHKFGNEGEGLGPDLTTLKSRFQRRDTLEAILDPSKTISDQYRGTVIVTVQGQTITGLAAPQGNTVTVLQTDGSKVTINKADIESQIASTVSPMPEKLIDELTLQEIADLLAYLESNPK
ncbi:MAG: c-type cytochrome [Planctomycetia bacterium]|nr:c-type cytochrome [Planctomycetia bacterium]